MGLDELRLEALKAAISYLPREAGEREVIRVTEAFLAFLSDAEAPAPPIHTRRKGRGHPSGS